MSDTRYCRDKHSGVFHISGQFVTVCLCVFRVWSHVPVAAMSQNVLRAMFGETKALHKSKVRPANDDADSWSTPELRPQRSASTPGAAAIAAGSRQTRKKTMQFRAIIQPDNGKRPQLADIVYETVYIPTVSFVEDMTSGTTETHHPSKHPRRVWPPW